MLPEGAYYFSGNDAAAEGALAAGCRFYAGYPITPSSEMMERMAARLPEVGGVFIQMEDEIASISAVIGAAWAGAKAMTATSGPGFSLMQEAIGYAAFTETPCVIVDVQRAGPCTGQATKVGSGRHHAGQMGLPRRLPGDRPLALVRPGDVRSDDTGLQPERTLQGPRDPPRRGGGGPPERDGEGCPAGGGLGPARSRRARLPSARKRRTACLPCPPSARGSALPSPARPTTPTDSARRTTRTCMPGSSRGSTKRC